MQSSASPRIPGNSLWPHRLAVAICCAAFPLVWVGGLVTTYDAGMAVPDWPSTFGYNLFLYPWQTWLFGPFDLLIEHGHRLLGATVGMLAVAFVIAVLRCDSRRSVRQSALALLALVLAQGILGGLRVRLDERVLAMLHACLGLATFAYAAAMAVVTSQYAREVSVVDHALRPRGRQLVRMSVLTAVLIYFQVVLGALLRHVPVGASPMYFRMAVLFHVGLGIGVAAHVLMSVARGWQVSLSRPRIRGPLLVLAVLIVVQLGLGAGTWVVKYGWPSWFAEQSFAAGYVVQANSLLQAMMATMHVAVGAMMLVWSVVLALRSWIFFRLSGAQRSLVIGAGKRRLGWVT